ncbi:ABC transporter permease [Thermasporomyces composti]|jgi:peptide/nickel transport system permease protein|uniref:Peptide/nickel transport system permease protein n=1 Tax=Thermasporomyces composti TaxID=696763 RepID=A0A3D9VCW1_THECX|nr:ABC transporter permease [Thermasporomyces composti]REF38000.1 peptide/nickel transport system permease protein [Thermasporomyces composti]
MTQLLSPREQPEARPPVEDDAVATSTSESAVAVAPQWKLVWWGFKRHRLAVTGGIVTLLVYFMAIFAEFLAPYSSSHYDPEYAYAPPQRLHFVDDGDWGLYVYGYTSEQDPETLELTWSVDESQKVPVKLFARGEEYKLFGLIPSDIHLIGPADPDGPPMYLLGADRNGHDLLSRIIHGARVSMSIGLVGVAVAFVLGIVLGGISGYFGGVVDLVIQRAVEFFMSIPTLPLWLGLAAAVPPGWGPLRRYFAVTVILSLIAWTDLARVVRGRFLSLREEDFVTAAEVDGASQPRIIFRHMLPSFTSHLIASLTLSIPGMILAETSLSFLGLGLQAPVVSWGVLLQEAQQIRVVATAPWLMLPGVMVVVTVLSLNFLGDGLRDAADPYKH